MAGWVTGGYPGGSVEVTTGDNFPWKQNPCKLVLHTTEGSSYPNWGYNKSSHVTIHPRQRTWRQHRRLDQPAWTLKAPAGAVSTNSMGAIQIEIIGYAATIKDLSGGDLEYLTGFIQFILDQTGISNTCTIPFRGADKAVGANAETRMSAAAWTAYRGILGHQHVPNNDHWDPGDIPMQSTWLPMIQGQPAPTPPKDVSEVSVIQGTGQTAIYSTDGVFKRHLTSVGQVNDMLRVAKQSEIILVGGETINILETLDVPTAVENATEVWKKQPPTSPVEVVVNAEVVAAAVVEAINAQGVDISDEAVLSIANKTVEQVKALTYKAV